AGRSLTNVPANVGKRGVWAGVYDQALVQADPLTGHLYCMTVPITVAGACTITATMAGSPTFTSMWAAEYSGLSTAVGVGSSVVDVSAGNNGTIATSMASGTTPATSAAGELALAVFGDTYGNTTLPIPSPGAPWTQRFNDTAGHVNQFPLIADDETPSSGATVTATWTAGSADGANGFAAGVVVFALPSSGNDLALRI